MNERLTEPNDDNGVWPPSPNRPSVAPSQATKGDFLFGKSGRDQQAASLTSFLMSIILLASLLFIALDLQGKYGKSYDLMGRREPDSGQARLIAFCVWGTVVVLNLGIAGFLRRYPSFTQVFLICTALLSLFTLYIISAYVYSAELQ